jgi:hypothetical protein
MRSSGTITVPSRLTTDDYDGAAAFPDSGRPPSSVQGRVRVGVTTAFVVVPFAGLGVAVWLAWGHGLNLADILLALAFYVITGLGVTVGFHRLLTHRSFTAVPALRVALAIAGSMSLDGEVIGWVAIHRRHRPARGPAFPLPVRQQRGRAVPRARARPRGLAVARRPDPARLDSRRRGPGQDQQPALQPGGPWTAAPAAPARRGRGRGRGRWLSPLCASSDRIR